MGLVKDFLTEHDFYPLSGTYVCSRCFEDYGLKEYISKNAEYDECSFCGKWAKKKKISIHINDFIIYFLECIKTEWGDSNNEGVGWESKEGGWVSARVIDTYDLFDELGIEIKHDELQDLLIQSLSDKEWCQRDPHGLLPDDDLLFSWQRFSRQIKHESRFVFFRLNTNNQYSNASDIFKEPYEIMEHLGYIANELNLIRVLPKDTNIFRARISSKGVKFKTLEELGPPDASDAKYSNRMSPAGIPMFYGSLEKKTSMEEIFDPNKINPAIVSIATFRALDDIKVLDLTNVPNTPSIFDEKNRQNRFSLSFLNAFLSDFTKSITKDGREHVEYVPTQVVTEYFRHVFLDEEGTQIQGILYPSSRQKRGIACVLFFEQSNCTEILSEETPWKKRWLFLDRKKTKYIKINRKNN